MLLISRKINKISEFYARLYNKLSTNETTLTYDSSRITTAIDLSGKTQPGAYIREI